MLSPRLQSWFELYRTKNPAASKKVPFAFVFRQKVSAVCGSTFANNDVKEAI